MQDKVKITILSFLTLFLSLGNLNNGLVFQTTDNTERDAVYAALEEKETIDSVKKPEITSVNVPVKQTAQKTVYKQTTKKVASKNNTIQITGKTITLRPTDCNTMSKPDYSSANYCHFRGSDSLFVYGHNTSNIFGQIKNLKAGSTFTITLNNQTVTYKVTKSFVLPVDMLNSKSKDAGVIRAQLFSGTYDGKSDITIQTCEGKNDINRRYIKAVHV
jgi:sortase (surface protein transpeptidase)